MSDLCRGETESGKPCSCGLTQVQLKEAGIGIGGKCPECNHTFGQHPSGAGNIIPPNPILFKYTAPS
jgi:hypothetical protein